MKVAACQVPDIREDTDKALAWIETYVAKAESQGVELLCFPECFLQGYLVDEDLARRHALDLRSPAFEAILQRLAHAKPTLVFGLIELDQGALFNTAVVIASGRLCGVYRKVHLLDGERIFQPGERYPVFETGGLKFGINICWDTNFAESAAALAVQGAALIVCPANNMMRRERAEKYKHLHNQVRGQRAKETGLWLISADVTGENERSIALGPTAVLDPNGCVVAQVPLLEVGMVVVELDVAKTGK
jgi:predicted amidohydrolase